MERNSLERIAEDFARQEALGNENKVFIAGHRNSGDHGDTLSEWYVDRAFSAEDAAWQFIADNPPFSGRRFSQGVFVVTLEKIEGDDSVFFVARSVRYEFESRIERERKRACEERARIKKMLSEKGII